MICLFPMCRLLHCQINPNFADHPFIKHKIPCSTPCTAIGSSSKYNLTVKVPDEIPGEGWLTYKEFLVKSFLIGIIYVCLIVIYRFSRDFLYWIDSPRRRVRKFSTSRRCAEKLMGILNLLVTPANLAEYERPSNEMQISNATGVPDTQNSSQETMINT